MFYLKTIKNNKSRHFTVMPKLSIFSSIVLVMITSHVHASTFDWSTVNNQVQVGSNSFSLIVDGITAKVEAYTTEYNANNQSYSIIGSFPVNIGAGFNGTYTQGAEGLSFRAESSGSLTLVGREGCANGGCGFDNQPYLQDNSSVQGDGTLIPKSNFALISFSQPVSLSSLQMDRVSNYDRDFWVATSQTAPDLSLDFITAFAAYSATSHLVTSGNPLTTDFGNSHNNFQYMIVGAPLDSNLGNFNVYGIQDGGSDSFNFHQFTVQAAVPLPSAWLLWVSALSFIGVLNKKRAITS